MLDVTLLMSDPLDPADAFLSGATEGVKRLMAFAFVTAGAGMLGLNIHEIPNYVARIQTNGIGSVLESFKYFQAGSPILWILMMLHSMMIWYLVPFSIVYISLLVSLWRGAEMFPILVGLALIHPIHAFLYAQRSSGLSGGDLVLAIGALVFCQIFLAGAILWWRHLSESAPIDEIPSETEPEL